jgi:outer membrane protein assembly factor BamD (BamD/ComL family)
MLQPNYESLIAQANDSRRGPEAETAQLWLAKSYYLAGLVHSKERLPQTQGNHLRHASPEEEIAYLSALAEYERFLERFPNSEHREEAAYHVAAVHYHLTYRGHHRHQVEKAIQAYQDFIDDYPESEKVPRAYLNLLGMSLEIARMDGEGFDRVIDNYETLMANYPDANDYVALRAKLIAAEAYYEGKKDYDQVFALCNELLDEPGTLQMPGVFGNAIKLRGLTNVVVDNLAESVLDFTLLIDFYQNSEFHFNYKVRQSLACAYFYRGFSSMVMGRTQKAIGDFQKVIDDFEDTQYFVDAEKLLDRLSQ